MSPFGSRSTSTGACNPGKCSVPSYPGNEPNLNATDHQTNNTNTSQPVSQSVTSLHKTRKMCPPVPIAPNTKKVARTVITPNTPQITRNHLSRPQHMPHAVVSTSLGAAAGVGATASAPPAGLVADDTALYHAAVAFSRRYQYDRSVSATQLDHTIVSATPNETTRINTPTQSAKK